MSTDTDTKTREETEIVYSARDTYGKKVILFNDPINSFDHVEDCLIRICFKSKEKAMTIALKAHNTGKAVCYEGSMEECETVAEKMGKERLTVSIDS